MTAVGPGTSSACPSCGAPLEVGDAFCMTCGQPLAGAPGASMPALASTPESLSPATVSGCPVCGAPLEVDDAFCIGCGRPAASAARPATEPPSAAPRAWTSSPAANTCAHCGGELMADDTFCTGCGRATTSSVAASFMAAPVGPPVASGVVIDPSAPDTCPACGIELKFDERFCRGCGRLIRRAKR